MVEKHKGVLTHLDKIQNLPICHRVQVRYIIHLYCLAVQASFYSNVVECYSSDGAWRVFKSP